MTTTFGQRLREAIAANQMTISDMARHMDCDPTNLYHYTRGRIKPGMDTLERMVRALPNVDVWWLISGERRTS